MLETVGVEKKDFVGYYLLRYFSLLHSSLHTNLKKTNKILVISVVIRITGEVSVTPDQHLPNYPSERRGVNHEIISSTANPPTSFISSLSVKG